MRICKTACFSMQNSRTAPSILFSWQGFPDQTDSVPDTRALYRVRPDLIGNPCPPSTPPKDTVLSGVDFKHNDRPEEVPAWPYRRNVRGTWVDAINEKVVVLSQHHCENCSKHSGRTMPDTISMLATPSGRLQRRKTLFVTSLFAFTLDDQRRHTKWALACGTCAPLPVLSSTLLARSPGHQRMSTARIGSPHADSDGPTARWASDLWPRQVDEFSPLWAQARRIDERTQDPNMR